MLKKYYYSHNNYNLNPNKNLIKIQMLINKINNTHVVFYKLDFENIRSRSILSKLVISYLLSSTSGDKTYDIYLLEDIDDETKDEIVTNILNGTITPYNQNVEAEYNEEKQEIKINVELDNLDYDLYNKNKRLVIGIKHNFSIPDGDLIQLTPIDPFSCFAYVNEKENFGSSKLDNYKYDEFIDVNVNNATGEVLLQTKFFSTLNQKMPINFSVVKLNKTPTIHNLPFNFILSYQKNIYEEKNDNDEVVAFVIEDAIGNRQRFFKIDSSNESLYNKFFLISSSGDKYYNEINGAFMYVNNNEYKVYDKYSNLIEYIKSDSNLFITKITSNEGQVLNYTWSGTKLINVSLSTSSNNDITINYDSSNYIKELIYNNLDLKVEISYTDNSVAFKYMKLVNDSYVLLKSNYIFLDSTGYIEIYNNLNSKKLLFSHSNMKVESLSYMENSSITSSYSYTFTKNKTKVINHLGNSVTSTNDNLNRVIAELDNYNNLITYEYFESSDLVVNKTYSKVYDNKRSILINGDFSQYTLSNFPLNFYCTTSNDGDEIIQITDSEVSNIAFSAMKLSVKSDEKRFYQTINKKGGAGDAFTFTMMYKTMGEIEKFVSYIKVYYENGKNELFEIKDKKLNNVWTFISKSFVTSSPYLKIEIGVKYKDPINSKSVYIDNLQLFMGSKESYYSYNEQGSLIEVSNNFGASSHIIYGDKNKIDTIIKEDGTRYKYSYNTDNTIQSITDSKGNKISYEYDVNKFVIKETIKYNNETIITNYSNDKDGYLEEVINEFNDYYYQEMDINKNVNYVLEKNELEIYPEYTSYNELKKLTDFNYKHELSYNSSDRSINEIKIENGSLYKFIYDSLGNLLEVKLNGVLLSKFSYKEKNGYNLGLINSKEYFNGDKYLFNYDDKERIVSVYLIDKVIAEYSYDEYDKIINVRNYYYGDVNQTHIKTYTYDDKNVVKKIVDTSGLTSTYHKDNFNNLKKVNYNISGNSVINRSIEYNNGYEKNEFTFDSYINKLISLYNADVFTGDSSTNGLFGVNSLISTVSRGNENNLSLLKIEDESSFMWIDLSSVNSKLKNNKVSRKGFSYDNFEREFENNKSFAMWFKPKDVFKETSLMKFQKYDTTSNEEIYSDIKLNLNGKLEYYLFESTTPIFTTSNSVLINKWNLLVVNIINNSIYISLNGANVTAVPTSNISSINRLLINYHLNDELSSSSSSVESLTTQFDICLLSISVNHGSYSALYRDGDKVLNSNNNHNQLYSTRYQKSSNNNLYNIISLNGVLFSNKGDEPVELVKRSKCDTLFNYDVATGKYYLGAYSKTLSNIYGYERLGYNLGLANSGVVSVRFRSTTASSNYEKEIVRFVDVDDNLLLRIYIDNGVIGFETLYGHLEYENITINNNKWYTLTLFYNTDSFTLFIDNTKLGTINNALLFEDSILYLGGIEDNIMLNGDMEKLMYREGNISSSIMNSTVSNLINNYNDVIHNYTYDGLNRLLSKDIMIDGEEYNQSYIYNKTRVEEECILGEYRRYTYDSMGNVIKIESKASLDDNYSSIYEYTYDLYNRLVEEKDYSLYSINKYEYNNLGNLISQEVYGLDNYLRSKYTFTYGQVGQQELLINKKYNGGNVKNIEYNGYYPSKINNDELVFEGCRLKSYGTNKYFYNDEGLRTKKIVGSKEYEYLYDGNKLVQERMKNSNASYYAHNFMYNYNQFGELISVEYASKLYFYIKDALGNIDKIVDEDGTVVVKYKYNAWGFVTKNILVDSTNSGYYIANNNPFIYKGYYYDVETGLFMMGHRYYSPELCRFIQPDDIEYLDPSLINGLNLYCYCHNNPIMYYDPSGHVAISVGLLIAGFVIGALVGTASSIVTQGLTEGWDNINGWQVLLDGTIGGISGLLAFSGIGAFGSALISGGLGFVGSVGGDLIRNNGDWSQVNWGKAAVMTGMNFLLGWGPGVQNSKAIGKSLSSALSNNTGFKAISKALANPKASARGIQGAFNLYGKSLAQGISSALPGIMISRMDDAFAVMLSSAVSTTLFAWGTDYFGLL